MNPVDPSARTTLLLNRNYQAFSFCTARAAFKHLITGRVNGMDSNGAVVSWEGVDPDAYPAVNLPESTLSWKDGNIGIYEDQPYLRSAPNSVTGEETKWYIPTIAVCGHHFGFHKKRGENISLKTLYSIYKGVCQYCLEHIPMHQATKDHHMPKCKGGTNHDFNMVLACRKCNNEKDSIFPYFDVNGNEVKPKHVLHTGVVIPDVGDIREEWKPYLYLE